MKNLKFIGLAIFILFIFSYSNAHATINWTPLPQACLPERAVKWDNRFNNADQQAACHCPPKSYCPTTYEEFSDNSKAKMPMGFVMRCCEPVAAPERCPNGELKVAGKACVEPVTAQCPVKFYPNLVESGITNASGTYKQSYIDDKGSNHNFSVAAEWAGVRVDTLKNLFSWSLRLTNIAWWIHGDTFCKGADYTVYGLHFKWDSTICANAELSRLSGVNYNVVDFNGLIKKFTARGMTWFGIFAVPTEKLPNNLVNPDLLINYSAARLSFIEISKNGFVGDERAQTVIGGNYQSLQVEIPNIGLSETHKEFVDVCRGVAGEFVTVEYHDQIVEGKTLSCPYLQCRYLYDSAMESCLSSDTQITLANGTKSKIADLKVGDLLIGEDGKPSKVKAVNKYQSELRVLYGINGGKAMITGDHPIKTKEGWKVITDEAAKLYATELGFAKEPLKKGDKIITLDGEIEVKSIERHPNFEPVDTYNLKVEGNNSFTANDMIVKGFNKMEIKY